MTENEFKARTKHIALRLIRLIETLPGSVISQTIAKQLLRSGTSVGANYRAACRGKSRQDVIHKLSIVEEEADECLYSIELLIDAGLVNPGRVHDLASDINGVLAMTVASIKTMRIRTAKNPKSKT